MLAIDTDSRVARDLGQLTTHELGRRVAITRNPPAADYPPVIAVSGALTS
jgi:hypothetical protein